MVGKIIFWIDEAYIPYCMANFLQKKTNLEFYAIFDINYVTQNFFRSQKIVKFKKIWFLRDYLSTYQKKPNIDYLTKFEEKHKINLWTLAFSERRFYHYNEYRKFTHDEILSITEEQCRFYEQVLDEIKPDFMIIAGKDLHRNYLFGEICKAMGIKILLLNSTRFPDFLTISDGYDKLDDFYKNDKSNHEIETTPIENLEEYLETYTAHKFTMKFIDKKFSEKKFQLSIWNILMRHLKFFIFICNDEYRKFYENWGHTRLKFLTKKDFVLPFIAKRWYRGTFLDKNATKKIDSSQPFVFFPLQLEPERSLLFFSPFFTNQIEIIRSIAKSLPVSHKLFVKEHYSMKIEAWRKRSFYKEILEMPNVELVHPTVKPKILLKNCSMVVTITGTAGLEAGFYKKPSIVFADVSYSYLPFVHRIKKIEELPNMIRTCLKTNYDFSSLTHYINQINKNSFKFDFLHILHEIAIHLTGYNGMTKEIHISEQQMNKFLNDHKNEFDLLAEEHLKKIKKLQSQN